jgi:hypothetical protein
MYVVRIYVYFVHGFLVFTIVVIPIYAIAILGFATDVGVEVPLSYVLWWKTYLNKSQVYSKKSITSRIMW